MLLYQARKLRGKQVTLYSSEGEVIAGEVGSEFHDFGKGQGEMQVGCQWWPTAFVDFRLNNWRHNTSNRDGGYRE